MGGLLLGYDVGSSSIKATLMEAQTGKVIASATSPEKELEIIAKQAGWAEQNPETWWEHVKTATGIIKGKISGSKYSLQDVDAIGISYQMHGLVAVNIAKNVLRPSIIWCDSRAVSIGKKLVNDNGPERYLKACYNLPGNFTASKLRWVKENEPEIFNKIHKIMLPGDYIAMIMTGEIKTTPSGLSEGIMWNFQNNCLAHIVLDDYEIPYRVIPEIALTFSNQGKLDKCMAEGLGINPNAKVTYRAGDQPNNALSLGVLEPGQIAATAGTSGVVYGVSDTNKYDSKNRVNVFVHVNHEKNKQKYGVLMCLNGCGIQNSWLKHNLIADERIDYNLMDKMAAEVDIGSEGLMVFPYGNGAERTLGNVNLGASVEGKQFNIHKAAHELRAAQEGIVFALNYGVGIMRDMGVGVYVVRAGKANIFLSPIFGEAFANTLDVKVELINSDGSQGAARGAGIGAKIYKNPAEAFVGLQPVGGFEPDEKLKPKYQFAYQKWKGVLEAKLAQVK